MAHVKNNIRVLVAFMALMAMCSALSSCDAAAGGGWSKETCYTYPGCSVYPCEIYCVDRGFSKDGAYCKFQDADVFCCCRQK